MSSIIIHLKHKEELIEVMSCADLFHTFHMLLSGHNTDDDRPGLCCSTLFNKSLFTYNMYGNKPVLICSALFISFCKMVIQMTQREINGGHANDLFPAVVTQFLLFLMLNVF